jgi:hypothetical protein
MSRAAPPSPVPAREIGVYVHFPWCLRKCGYCDFASEAIERGAIPHAAYADALLAELAFHAAHLPRTRRPRAGRRPTPPRAGSGHERLLRRGHAVALGPG